MNSSSINSFTGRNLNNKDLLITNTGAAAKWAIIKQ